jgi:hypothetical protein
VSGKFIPNFFDGISEKVTNKFKQLIEFDSNKLFSLDIDMFDYGKYIKEKRLSAATTCDSAKLLDWDKVSKICRNIKTVKQTNLLSNHLIVGDSHSASVYVKGAVINRFDGKTLNGALRSGLKTFIEPYGQNISKLTFYFGNIDIRHHLMRQPDPAVALFAMLDEYEKQIKALNMDYVELISALPIENESRKLPKTGFYKGTPFAGTWAERTALATVFNLRLEEICHRNGWELYSHPDVYKNEKGELDFEVMEKPQSVHLARLYYRWDLENDCPNPNLLARPSKDKPKKEKPAKELAVEKRVEIAKLVNTTPGSGSNGKPLIEF